MPVRVLQGEELDVLADLVEHYEGKKRADGVPDARRGDRVSHGARGLTPRDLIPFIGSRSKVSEVLSGKRQPNHANGTGTSRTSGNSR